MRSVQVGDRYKSCHTKYCGFTVLSLSRNSCRIKLDDFSDREVDMDVNNIYEQLSKCIIKYSPSEEDWINAYVSMEV